MSSVKIVGTAHVSVAFGVAVLVECLCRSTGIVYICNTLFDSSIVETYDFTVDCVRHYIERDLFRTYIASHDVFESTSSFQSSPDDLVKGSRT